MENSNKIVSLLVILVMMLSYSCKKDTVNSDQPKNEVSYDTLFPLDYLPVFPDSWWKYIDSDGETSYLKTDSVYQIDTEATVVDTFYVPVYNGEPIWGYDAHTDSYLSHAGTTKFKTLLSETEPVGSSWLIHNWAGTGVSRKIIAKDTTIIIGDVSYFPTIGVEEYYSEGPVEYIWISRRYYTKNIGLVKEERYISSDSTVSSLELADYFVNF